MEEEQYYFEEWFYRVNPSGDATAVQRQWLNSSDYADYIAELLLKYRIKQLDKSFGDGMSKLYFETIIEMPDMSSTVYVTAQITEYNVSGNLSYSVSVISIENEYGDEIGMWVGYPLRLKLEQQAFNIFSEKNVPRGTRCLNDGDIR